MPRRIQHNPNEEIIPANLVSSMPSPPFIRKKKIKKYRKKKI
jgi:hypothetical protein